MAFQNQNERKFKWPRTMPRDDESEDHWIHRMRVEGFYNFRNSTNGLRYWPDHWGARPPANRAFYVEPPDEGARTNGASRRVHSET